MSTTICARHSIGCAAKAMANERCAWPRRSGGSGGFADIRRGPRTARSGAGRDRSAASAARAAALDGAGVLAETQGDYDRAEALHREALALSRERGDRPVSRAPLATSAWWPSIAATIPGRRPFSRRAWRWRGNRASLLVATALNDLGSVSHEQGDLERAEALYRESLALRRRQGAAPISRGR